MSIRIAVAGALFLLTAFSGCSKLKLGYEYADWFVVYSVEDNFELDKPQRNQLKGEVADYFSWHRKQMLPLYSEFLDDMAAGLKNGLRPPEIDSCYARLRALHRSTLGPVASRASTLLLSLNPEQIDAWMEKQKKKNLKLRKDFSGSLEDRLDHRFQKIVEELEDWTGRLSKEQRKKIKVLSATLPWNGLLWLDARERVQAHLGEMLKRRASKGEVEAYLQTYFFETDSLRTPEHRVRAREFETRTLTLIQAVYGVLTPVQRRQFILQIEKLAGDFRSLSRQE